MEIERRTVDWKTVTENDIRSAIEELGKLYNALSRVEKGSWMRNCCMDDFRNQTGSCACIEKIIMLSKSRDWDERMNHQIICQEIAWWFQAAGVLEGMLIDKKIGPTRFRDVYRRCIALKRSDKGIYTRMVDLSIQPVAPVPEMQENAEEQDEVVLPDVDGNQENKEEDVLDVYENRVISESTLCLNSVIHLWRKIAGGDFCSRSGNKQFLEWQELKYDAVLRSAAQLQEDVSDQVRKQRLFYSRVDDFLEAKGVRERVYFEKAQKTFQEKYNLGLSKQVTEHWRKRQVNYWKRWNFASIHILQSNSDMMYNPDTNILSKKLGMSLTHVSESTTTTLYEIADALEKPQQVEEGVEGQETAVLPV
jgi:hypothetical protein